MWGRIIVLGLPFSIALATFATTSRVAADLVTFRDGDPTPFVGGTYAGTEDVMLVSNSGFFEEQNFGARTNMEVGLAGGANNPRRSLIRFDVTALSGQFSSIDSVTLRLTLTNTGALGGGLDVSGSDTVQAFRPTSANSAWIEGTGISSDIGGPSDVGMSTFAQRVQGSQNWAGSRGLGTPGTDYLIVPVASQTFDANTLPGSTFDLVFTDVSFMSAWAAGSNSGLFLRTPEASSNASISFFTRNAANLDVRPELIVSYTPAAIPEPSGAILCGLVGTVPLVLYLKKRRKQRVAAITTNV